MVRKTLRLALLPVLPVVAFQVSCANTSPDVVMSQPLSTEPAGSTDTLQTDGTNAVVNADEHTAAPEDAGADDLSKAPGSEVIMTFGDDALTMQQIRWAIPNAGEAQVISLAETWLEHRLLYAEAVRRGMTNNPQLNFIADMSREGVFVQDLKKDSVGEFEITEEEVKEYYEENKDTADNLRMPEMITFSHVRTRTLEEAESARKRIEDGEKINDLAGELSVHADAAAGGRLERQVPGGIRRDFGRHFLDTVWKAEEGELLGPIKVAGGLAYEIVLLETHTESRPLSLAVTKESIERLLKPVKARERYDAFLESLEEQAADQIVKSPRLLEAEKKE